MSANRKTLKRPLRILLFQGKQKIFEKLFDTYPIVIGRSPKCDIPMPQFDFVSRQHAVITVEEKELQVVDLESSNGIFVKGQKVKRAPVSTDFEFNIGVVRLRFEYEESIDEVTPTLRDTGMQENTIPVFASDVKAPKESKASKPEIPEKNSLPCLPESKKIPILEIKSSKNIPKVKAPNSAQVETPALQSFKASRKIEPHPLAGRLGPRQRILEGYVTWKDQIYDVTQFHAGDKVSVGSETKAKLKLPTVKSSVDFAIYDGKTTKCFIPDGAEISVKRQHQNLTFEELMASQALVRDMNGYVLKMENEDLCSVGLKNDIQLHFRYAPAPRELSKKPLVESDDQIQRTTLISGIAHLFIIALAFLLAPNESDVPKLPNIPQRYARLLVKKPKPIVKPKPKPTPRPKIAKKKPPPKPIKRQRRPRKVVIKKPIKRPKVVSRVKTRVNTNQKAVRPVKKNITKVGALAALTALSSSAPSTNQPVAVNINQNAGGQSSPKIGGTIGALKSKSGRLAAGGIGQVKTKGLGVGTGTGMGIQGIKGTAGRRAVAGAVVGTPQVVKVKASNGLTQKQIEEVLRKYIGKIQQCYERSLLGNPNLGGSMNMEWFITPVGRVRTANVKRTDMSGADAMNSCIRGVFMSMKFPRAKNGQPTIATKMFKLGR